MLGARLWLMVGLGFCAPPVLGDALHILEVQTPGFGPGPVRVILDNSAGGPVAAWGFGVCHDPTQFAVDEIVPGTATTVEPDFETVDIHEAGWTASVILSFDQSETLAPAGDLELYVVVYQATGFFPSSSVDFCETLGSPPLAVTLLVDGYLVTPTTFGSTLIGFLIEPTVIFALEDVAVRYDVATGRGDFRVEPAILPGVLADALTVGFSMGVAHDPELLAVEDVAPIGVLAELRDGRGPEFFVVNVTPSSWTVSVVYSFSGNAPIALLDPLHGIAVEYTTEPTRFSSGECVATLLEWSESLGVLNEVHFVSGLAASAEVEDGLVFLRPAVFFLRGDCNVDGAQDLGDAIFLLSELFFDGPESPCAAGCDANDDGVLDVSDAIALLSFLFAGGAPLAAPLEECGPDPTPDSLSCELTLCP